MNDFLTWLFRLFPTGRIRKAREKNGDYPELALLAYQHSRESLAVVNAAHEFIAVNPAFERMTGYTEAEVLGRNVDMLNGGYHEPAFHKKLWQVMSGSGSWQGETWMKRKSGEEFPAWSTVTAVRDGTNGVERYLVQSMDFSERKEIENMLWRQANFDYLTTLPNARMCREWFRHELADCLHSGTKLALISIDLDNFREVNDAYGQEGGNTLLTEAARRIRECIRDIDMATRETADEFGVILTEINDIHEVRKVAGQLQAALSEPFDLETGKAHITASIGITICPDDGADEEALRRNAEHALHTAKARGKNCIRFFAPSMEETAKRRLFLMNDMRQAIGTSQFELVYQPVVELASGEIHKAESLLRWHHPSAGMVLPSEFIPVAEETGMIVAVSNWSFEQVARQAADWQKRFYPDFQICFNMSPMEFAENPENIRNRIALAERHGIRGKGIVVEITESMLLQSTADVNDRLRDFHEAGMAVALDDFGTGYSSLSYLKTFDVDYLKIDQLFVRDVENDQKSMALVEAIIVMGHKLGMKIIAEGIRNETQRRLLAGAGCDYGQGYLFSEPVPPKQFEQLLQEQKQKTAG